MDVDRTQYLLEVFLGLPPGHAQHLTNMREGAASFLVRDGTTYGVYSAEKSRDDATGEFVGTMSDSDGNEFDVHRGSR